MPTLDRLRGPPVRSRTLMRKRPRTQRCPVPTRGCAKGLDAVGSVHDRELPGLVGVLFDALFLQAAEEGFSHRVVPAVAPAAHARLDVVRAAEASPRIASSLGTLIRVNQGAAWSSATDGYQDGFRHPLAMDRRTCRLTSVGCDSRAGCAGHSAASDARRGASCRLRPLRHRVLQSLVTATPGDLEQAAHHFDAELMPVRLDELIDRGNAAGAQSCGRRG